MEISKKDLKKTSRRFRSLASNVINAYYTEVNFKIKIFIDYIDHTEVISDYVKSVLVIEDDLENDLKAIAGSYGEQTLAKGTSSEEEVSNIYQVLKYISEHGDFQTSTLGWGYTTSNNYQDMVKNFGDRIVLPFASQINEYLMDIATDMGYDEENKFMITVNGGVAQVNIATDDATNNAVQNNNQKLEEIIVAIKAMAEDNGVNTQPILENLAVIQSEVAKENPQKEVVQRALSSMKSLASAIPKATTFIESLVKMSEFLAPLLNR